VRLKLTVEYDGTPFRGWAAQPGLPTVESALRAALSETFDRFEALAVAGRTDTGVHALANIVSVDVEGGPPPGRVAAALNPRLPDAVSVVAVEPVHADFHARFSARARSYRYRIFTRRTPSPFESRRGWWRPQPVDDEQLAAQAALLSGEHDFRAFTPTQTRHSVFARVVESAAWSRLRDNRRQLPPAHGADARRDDDRRRRPGAAARRRSAQRRRSDRAAARPLPRRSQVLTDRSIGIGFISHEEKHAVASPTAGG
jgi:tRNA pseudouridine38-40 synthase